MARIPGPAAAAVYRAAEAFVDRALRRNGGLFVASRRVWAADVIERLGERFPATVGTSGVPFERRWSESLAGASPEAVQLAAELTAVHVLFAKDLSAATKHRLVDTTLALAPGTAHRPGWLDEACAVGLAGTGVAFKTRRLSQLRLLLDAVASWKRLSPPGRRRRLDDPTAFRDWLADVPNDGAYAQREALCHLVHPDAFEPIVSPRVKRDIVAGLGDLVPDTGGDVDRALAAARRALTPRFGEGFSFVDPAVATLWRRSPPGPTGSTPGAAGTARETP